MTNTDAETSDDVDDQRALLLVEKAAARCERMAKGGGGRAQRAAYAEEAGALRRAQQALKTDVDMADVRRAKAAFDARRTVMEEHGQECCLIVVGYATGREPFTLLGRVSADTGFEAMPDPPLSFQEMQPVAHAAKMAFAKVMRAKKKALRGEP